MRSFPLDEAIVAPVIYGTMPHRTTTIGVSLSPEIRQVLRHFLRAYNGWVGAWMPYYRIDAYFNKNTLSILEINAAFVDGWGSALNLARAAGVSVESRALSFPKRFATVEQVYRPELELFVRELSMLGYTESTICEWPVDACDKESTYVYGRVDDNNSNFYPRNGIEIDNKLNLAGFGEHLGFRFENHGVRVPRHYFGAHPRLPPAYLKSWDNIPDLSVLKFCEKDGAESRKARQSVIIGKPSGKAQFLRQCYEAGTLIAQEFVPPTVHDGNNLQLVILAAGDEPVTGYVQHSPKRIINDNSVHGPLEFE